MDQPQRKPVSATLAVVNIVLPFLILGAGVAIFLGLMTQRKPPAAADTDDGLPLVATVAAAPFNGNIEVTASGLVVPFREVTLTAEVDGLVVEKTPSCEAGKFVDKGTVLIRIDDSNYLLEVERLEAEKAQAQSAADELEREIDSITNQIQIAEADLAIREKELKRLLDVNNPGVFSERERDSARRNLLTAQNTEQSLKDQQLLLIASRKRMASAVALAEAQLKRARLDLQRCEIKSPTSGVVVAERVEQDVYVTRGTTLALVEDTSQVEVECNLRIDELRTIRSNATQQIGPYELPPNKVIVEYETGQQTLEWDGILSRVNGVGVDSKTRTVPCLVDVANPILPDAGAIRTLVRGMFVNLRVQVPSKDPLLVLPARALQGKESIWVVKDGKLHQAIVDVLTVNQEELDESLIASDNEMDEMIVVRQQAGLLEPGSEIVVTPIAYAIEGQEVKMGAEPKPKSDESNSNKTSQEGASS